MAITLNIDFVGLCLWVDEPVPEEPQEGGRPRLHVLLLAPDLHQAVAGGNDGHDGHDGGTARHHPRLFYDTAYDTPGAGRLNDAYNSISLEDKALDLTGFPGTLDPALPGVPDLTKITGGKVPRPLLGASPGELVTARISLAAGKGAGVDPETPWDLGTEKGIPIAHKVRWTLSVDALRLDWSLLGLNGHGGQPLVPLHPVHDTIDLRIVNVPRADLSRRDDRSGSIPLKGHRMEHFSPFYLALKGQKDKPVPVWQGEGDGDGGPIGGNFNCGEGRAMAA